MWFFNTYIMPRRNYRMSIHFGRSFDDPVTHFLFFKTAFITYEPWLSRRQVFDFTPLILFGSHSQDFVTAHPQANFAATFRTIPMRINGLSEPYSILEPESSVC